jgi:branched-chain amino acid transport system ATP-binding protein
LGYIGDADERAGRVLAFQDVSLHFGGVAALDGVTFSAAPGQVTGLIGPNGAGKTSLFNCATRIYQPSSGRISFDGIDLLQLSAHQIPVAGIGRTYQNLALFPTLTVLENVMMGAHVVDRHGFVLSILRTRAVRSAERARREEARDLIQAFGLSGLEHHRAEGLPFGTLKRVELARALASRPRALLLDEPAGGLTRREVAELGDLLLTTRANFDLLILMVEHHLGLVGQICNHLVVMSSGSVLVEGEPDEVRRHPAVIEAYLGDA